MFTLKRTDEFNQWLKNLKDPIAKRAINTRLIRLQNGNFGDIASVGDGIFELRIHVSAGYRIYAIQRGDTLILVLNAGNKSSQQADIEKAKELNKEWEFVDENDEDSDL